MAHKISARKAKKDFLKGEEELHEVMERKLHGKKGNMPKKKGMEVEVEIEVEHKDKKKKHKKPAAKKKMKKEKY